MGTRKDLRYSVQFVVQIVLAPDAVVAYTNRVVVLRAPESGYSDSDSPAETGSYPQSLELGPRKNMRAECAELETQL